MRITRRDQLEQVSPLVRAQLEQHIDALEGEPGERKTIGRPEQEAGRALIQWVDALYDPVTNVRPGQFFVHTPNGGFRDPKEAAIFYGQGVRKGWPDYTLYLARQGYHGLVLELKADGGAKPDKEQLDILHRLEQAGYCACVAWGFDDARRAISRYLDLPR